ncbi:MIP family channel protein [Candidatus Poribacteria bacterium]|nr:MIP family channel protein [Candidatus Poribacteria bacterium]
MKVQNFIAEFIGTFALIFIGAGALAISPGNLVAVAVAHGLVIVAFVYAYGHISGTHINPAVTLGLLVAGEIQWTAAIGYWVVQFAGGIAGALLLKAILPMETDLGVTILTTVETGGAFTVTQVQGLFVEIILTFFLVNTILNTAVSGKVENFAGLAIGLTLVLCILMGGPLTRASLNPARTLGPAIAAANYANLWLYFVGPFAGGVLAALLYIGVFKKNDVATE